jgi:hypothetical protein
MGRDSRTCGIENGRLPSRPFQAFSEDPLGNFFRLFSLVDTQLFLPSRAELIAPYHSRRAKVMVAASIPAEFSMKLCFGLMPHASDGFWIADFYGGVPMMTTDISSECLACSLEAMPIRLLSEWCSESKRVEFCCEPNFRSHKMQIQHTNNIAPLLSLASRRV